MVVRVGADESETFQTEQGVRPECISTSQLFNIYGEHIIREALEHWTGGISIGEKRIFNLRHTDDITLIALDEEEMAELVNLVNIASKKLEPRINASKTKVTLVDRTRFLPISTALSENENINAFVY